MLFIGELNIQNKANRINGLLQFLVFKNRKKKLSSGVRSRSKKRGCGSTLVVLCFPNCEYCNKVIREQ